MAFVKKIRLFIIYVFWANQARKDRFLVILDKKKSFLHQKKKLLKKSKNSKFSMVFVEKSNFLSSMSFGQIKPEKIVFWYTG